MPAFVMPAALSGVGKLIGAIKASKGLGAAASFAKGAAGKTSRGLGGFAKDALGETFNRQYIANDVLFGTMAGMMTPGDWQDKVTAGLADAGLSALAGGSVRSIPGLKGLKDDPSPFARGVTSTTDMVAGMGGAFGGAMLSEEIQRGRYGGMSLLEQEQARNVAQIQQQAVADYINGGQAYDQALLGPSSAAGPAWVSPTERRRPAAFGPGYSSLDLAQGGLGYI